MNADELLMYGLAVKVGNNQGVLTNGNAAKFESAIGPDVDSAEARMRNDIFHADEKVVEWLRLSGLNLAANQGKLRRGQMYRQESE
jgi:hypothetical protein